MMLKFGMRLALVLAVLPPWIASSQVTSVGSGSYATTQPTGTAGPTISTPYVTATGPVATHKFWTAKNWYPLGDVSSTSYYMNPQPLDTHVTANGLQIGMHEDVQGWDPNSSSTDKSSADTAFYQYSDMDLTIGNASLNATKVNVSAASDWMVDLSWGASMTARIGRGMPFAYVLTDGTAPTVTFLNGAPTILSGTIGSSNILAVSEPEATTGYTNYYALFCPTGGNWSQKGSVLTCNSPSGKNYMSVALLPQSAATNLAATLSDYSKYAYSFPTNTAVSWSYNESASTVSTTYAITTKAMEGTETGFLAALYPHQYDTLSGSSINTSYTYTTSKGTMEVLNGTSFTTVDTYHGILPFIPPTSNINTAKLKAYVDEAPVASSTASDTYANGKSLGAAAQVVPLAKYIGDTAAYDNLHNSIESSMENWFTATSTKSSAVFYYDSTWGTLIGYPAAYDSNDMLDDHNFHYGYWIHAAAIDGLYNPSWIKTTAWGGMVGLLVQDIANSDRTNTMFPFLRCFDVYAGHSWASGNAPFTDGENEESSSEGINAWAGMILYGTAIGDKNIRDTGIWLYTQEAKGISYYWFNGDGTKTNTFPNSWWTRKSVANVFDDKDDIGTWFGSSPDYEHAIEFMPYTGGSYYLGLNPTYVEANYLEDYTENGNTTTGGAWPDLMEMYEALYDPDTALTNWTTSIANSSSVPTGGESLAHEYVWMTSLKALGQVDASVTANTPYYAVFKNGGTITHIAYNPGTTTLPVTFSDGASLSVPAATMLSDNNGVSVAVGAGTTTVTVPDAPTGLTATAVSANEIDLAWTYVNNVTYDVYRSTTSGFTPSSNNRIASGLTAASYSDMSLTASTEYYYAVDAVNSVGTSAVSAQNSATTSASGNTIAESNTLYLTGGATSTAASTLAFTEPVAGTDSIPANNPQSPNTVENPLTYTIKGINGTYDSTSATKFSLYVDAGANAGEAVQAQVIYDMLGDGTNVRTEQYGYFAADAAAGWENYLQSSGGGIESANTSGSFSNMSNGTVTLKVWDALPGTSNAAISLSVGSTSSAISDLVIPFTGVTQTASTSAPIAPTGLSASGASGSTASLSWTASVTAGVTYSVYRSTAAGFTPGADNLIISSLKTLAYTDTGLTASTTYYYVVAAVNSAGSAYSTQVSATTSSSGSGTSVSNTLYLTGGATATVVSALSFTEPVAGTDSIPANNPQSPDAVDNPLVYAVTGLTGTYNSSAVTQFDLFVDAGSNAGEAPQVQVIYDMNGDGTNVRTEQYSYFATNAAVDWEDYAHNSRGGLEAGHTSGTLGNMTNGTVKIKVWDALPGANYGPISLSVGSTSGAISNLVIPFTGLTQMQLPVAPVDVQAIAKSASEVDVTWTASTTSGVTYNVYRSTTSGFTPGSSTLLGNVSTDSYDDTSVSAETTYYYVVSAANSSGSAAASQVSATTPAATIVLITPTVGVTPASSTITTAAPLKLTVTVSGGSGNATPTGSVALSSGSYTSSSATLSGGSATITIGAGALAIGSDTVTVTYTPDTASAAIYKSATGSASAVVNAVAAPSFVLSNSGNITINSGATSGNTSTITITPSGGFTGRVALSCAVKTTASNSAEAVTCKLGSGGTSSSSVTVSGATASTAMLTAVSTAESRNTLMP